MQKIAIIQINETGQHIADKLCRELCRHHADDIAVRRIARQDVAQSWHHYDAFVFIGAMGICVRTIAPLVNDKHTDPAVVCTDSLGRHAVAVLSGHVGGANHLTLQVATAIGAQPVITTQSDNAGLWAIDTLGRRFGWHTDYDEAFNQVIINFVNRKPIALVLAVRDEGTTYLEATRPEHVTIFDADSWHDGYASRFAGVIIVSPYRPGRRVSPGDAPTIHFVPKVLTVGIGLARQAEPADGIVSSMRQELASHGLDEHAVEHFATIDLKADEPVVKLLADGHEVILFSARELAAVSVPNPSASVQKHVGTPSVCEAAAILAAGGGNLIVEKVKGENYTLAVAIDRKYLRSRQRGHVEIVGAGPGDPELISVRGRRMLEQADLILYAGSLVPRELTLCHKPGAVVRSSADMTLDQQCTLMKHHYDQGHFIVRLHTGDPCIFGAIQEQMAFFDLHQMAYHITPGISSFLAAAAELRSQLTIPERTQTIILTRGEGRTPMPTNEQLALLARSHSTMCIFLSAAIADDVQRQLLTEYPEDTPIAACYHLTWPDQRICRGKLKDLASIVRDNHLTLTTMIVVGEAIGNRQGHSQLYDENFTHLYRQGSE